MSWTNAARGLALTMGVIAVVMVTLSAYSIGDATVVRGTAATLAMGAVMIWMYV